MAQVSTNSKDDSKDSSGDKLPEVVANPSVQASGISTSDLEKRIGSAYGSGVELVEGKEDDKYVAKLRSTSYGTGTFVLDGRGDTADEARTDLYNRIPIYNTGPAPEALSEPHDYARPNAV